MIANHHNRKFAFGHARGIRCEAYRELAIAFCLDPWDKTHLNTRPHMPGVLDGRVGISREVACCDLGSCRALLLPLFELF